MNIKDTKQNFPVLARHPDLVYLDSAATSQTPDAVLEAMNEYYENTNANVHRGVYETSVRATHAYENARIAVARFVKAAPEEIIFTSGTTMSLNLLAYSIGPTLHAGDEVITTIMEHHSNLVPWQEMSKRYGFTLKYIEVTPAGELNMNSARTLIGPSTKVLTMVHMSNALGTINPVKELCARAHEYGAITIVDGAQSVAHMSIDVRELGADFFAFSGHKMYGPKGIGVLYGARERLERLDPFLYGGDMISEVTLEGAQWNEIPYRFEAGTPNIPGVIGLGVAVNYINNLGMESMVRHETELTRYALDTLKNIDGLTIYGPQNEHQRAVISFTVNGIHPHDLGTLLDREQVAIRVGHHCAMPLMHALGLQATVRASLSIYNSKEDVEKLVAALEKAKKIFKV